MIPIDRRRFLQMLTGAVGAAASGEVLPASVRRALETPAHRRTGTIQDVEHVVVLMQENRSFDHYFGSLRGVRGFSDPRPLHFPDGKPVWYQTNASVYTPKFYSCDVPPYANYVLPFHIDTRESGDHQRSTDHSWSTGHLSWNQGKYDQWITQKQDVLTMGYLRRADLTFHYALADAFTICDNYFSSVPADTAINRIYLWSGTSDPRNVLGRIPNGPGLAERPRTNGYTWTTYPERLESAGISWKLYQGGTGEPGSPTDNFTDNSLEFFANYQVAEGADPHGPLVNKGASQHTLKELRDDVLKGRLPQVSWIVAPFLYCEHPASTASDGAAYINLVLDALTASADSWSKTVLFLCYDENDGLFDHIVPPMPPSTSELNRHGMVSSSLVDSLRDEFLDLDVHTSMVHPLVPGTDPGGLQPLGLGMRVPMIVVSPWTTGGWVCSQTFDHTSILKFLESRFGVAEPNISAWRRAVCGDLTSAFDFGLHPDIAMPHLQVPKSRQGVFLPISAPAVPTMPTQEAGLRPARPIPYDWQVDPRVDASGERLWFDFINTGKAAATFYAYNNAADTSYPRRYAVVAGDRISDYWLLDTREAAYDIIVYGPNGYLCHARGETPATKREAVLAEALLRYESEHCQLRIIVSNAGRLTCSAVLANAYASNTSTLSLAPGASIETIYDLTSSSGWYDVSLTLESSDIYLRRFAGHLETGRPSTSDPGPLSVSHRSTPAVPPTPAAG
ncbi:MAG: phospholipase C, phosphocholine-specific [Rhodanobacter sp.]